MHLLSIFIHKKRNEVEFYVLLSNLPLTMSLHSRLITSKWRLSGSFSIAQFNELWNVEISSTLARRSPKHCTLPSFISCYSHLAPFTGLLAVHMTCQAHNHLNTFPLLLFPMPQMIPLNRYRFYSLSPSGRFSLDWCSTVTPLPSPGSATLFPIFFFFPMAFTITYYLVSHLLSDLLQVTLAQRKG